MFLEDLPVSLMVEILSRLPVKTIIHCKCVCKKWLDLISDSYFVNLHMSRSPTILMLHLDSRKQMTGYHAGGILKWVEVDDELDHHHLHHDPVMSLDLDPITRGQGYLIQVGSVNGLICLRQHGYEGESTYICNPTTREYMILPRQQIYREDLFCFGVGSLSQEYKVLGICLRTLEAKVYTLGTGRWRSPVRVPYSLKGIYGPFLNGHAHWIVDDDQGSPEGLCAFDFDRETFNLFPSPPSKADVEESYEKSLGVLKGCLCLCDTHLYILKAWVMKEYGIKKSWHKELVIQCSIGYEHDLLFVQTYIIEGLKDGTILMGCYEKTLFVYCPRRNTIIVDPEIVKCYIKGFAYRPSFHRLQNFENERVHVL